MAYGDDLPPDELFGELEHTELLFRTEDLVREWFRAFHRQVWAPVGRDALEEMLVQRAEQRLEETAMELALYLKARRLEREESRRPKEPKRGAA